MITPVLGVRNYKGIVFYLLSGMPINSLLPSMLERIQGKLNEGKSATSIAKEENISEGSIHYATGLGRLKKNILPKQPQPI